MNLKHLQENFFNYIINKESNIAQCIEGPSDEYVAERLSIYSEGFWSTMEEVQAADFIGVKHLVGEEVFSRITRAYFEENLPQSYTLRYVGKEFKNFVANHPDTKGRADLLEMCDFEWGFYDAIDCTNDPILTLDDLKEVAQEDFPYLSFTFHRGTQFFSFYYNVVPIFKAVYTEEKTGDDVPVIDKIDKPTPWALWRKEMRPHYMSLDEPEHFVLSTLKEGGRFLELCEGLTTWYDETEVSEQAVLYLTRFIKDEMIASYQIKK